MLAARESGEEGGAMITIRLAGRSLMNAAAVVIGLLALSAFIVSGLVGLASEAIYNWAVDHSSG